MQCRTILNFTKFTIRMLRNSLNIGSALLLSACAMTAGPPQYSVAKNNPPVSRREAEAAIVVNAGFNTNRWRQQFDRPPTVKKAVLPDYPLELRKMGLEGAVSITLTVLPDGRIGEIDIEKSPNVLLSEQVVKAVREWEFYPITREGRAVTVRIPYTYRYTLK